MHDSHLVSSRKSTSPNATLTPSDTARHQQHLPRRVTTERNWSCVRGLPGAAMAAVTAQRKIVMVREFRPNVLGQHVPTWNLPRGAVENGETPLGAALREFAEETGLELDARQGHVLGEVRADNGLILHSVTICWAPVATDEDCWAPPRDAEEQILEVRAFDQTTLRRMLARGELQDGYLFSALGLLQLSGLF